MQRLHQDEVKREELLLDLARSLEPEPVGSSPKRLRMKCTNTSKAPEATMTVASWWSATATLEAAARLRGRISEGKGLKDQ
jgi:hypothetical protein